MEPVVVTLGRWPAALRAPSIVWAYELASAVEHQAGAGYHLAVQAAALRLCWPSQVTWPAQVPPPPLKLGGSLPEWGAGIADALVAAGLSVGDISAAGAQAIGVALALITPAAAVQAAEKNSEGPPVIT